MYRLGRIDLPKPSADDRFARFDETEELICFAVLVTATDPGRKRIVFDRHGPTPILRVDSSRLHPFGAQPLLQVFGESFSPKTWVDFLLLAVIGREFAGTKFDLRFHNLF